MKIALIGYGKMGKAIETIAIEKGHHVGLRADSKTVFDPGTLREHDVAIEFTSPHAALGNIALCLKAGVPVVVGSTGWYNRFDEVQQLVQQYNGGLLYATNFSIGVNLFFSFNAYIAKIMGQLPDYEVTVHEVHHTQKLDAPSGTAITTAETIVKNHAAKQQWVHEKTPGSADLLITHARADQVPGTHVVRYSSEIDDITLTHTAHNRKGFASGALAAAEWMKGKKGIFTMKDVLGIDF